jgi:hypothetical protein
VAKWRISLNFVSIPSIQYSNSPHVDTFVASIETRKLFVDRPLVDGPCSVAAELAGPRSYLVGWDRSAWSYWLAF